MHWSSGVAELITALDHPDAPSAVEFLDALPDGAFVKVGSVLATAAGPGFVRGLVDGGYPVFLDLKWHDIPNTVGGAVRSARALGVEMVTVHALGGPAMLEAALTAAAGELRVVAVTVLTSHNQASLGAALGHPVAEIGREAVRLATLALTAGVDGIVCSPEELELLAPLARGKRLVVPGIRRADDARGDQVRIATPESAVTGGATHLVVGRPITAAADPAAAWHAFRGAIS